MKLGEFFFQYRGYLPIPLALIVLYFSNPVLPLMIPGSIIIIFGEIIRLSGVRYAGGETRTRNVGAPELCTDGPFAYVRNPLYIGNYFVYFGVILFSSDGGLLIPLLTMATFYFIAQYGLIIQLEEQTLINLFGEKYKEYCKNVPRILPRLSPWKLRNNTFPNTWKKTFITEKRTLQTIFIYFFILFIKVSFLT
jgi:protein-S-isoprenylcysteine O-methyltransferase Ste14|tara:strand:- start:32026 stop:32607 length:582 start_codon:yes stop_codon:yes gene_type:complete